MRAGLASRLLAVLIAILATSLAPLAYACPPASLWIAGVYDYADEDGAAGLIADEGLAIVSPPGARAAFVRTIQRGLPRHDVAPAAATDPRPFFPRPPPGP